MPASLLGHAMPRVRRSSPRRESRYPSGSPHRTPTRHASALWTGLSEGGLGAAGCYWGQDLLGGGSLCLDPWELYNRLPAPVVTSGDVVVFGRRGRGKSAGVKVYFRRQVGQYGRKAVILDLKPEKRYGGRGEWTGVAEDLGARSLRLAPRGGFILNPITNAAPEPVRLEQLTNLGMIAKRAELSGTDRNGFRIALQTADRYLAATAASGETTLPLVADMMLRPTATAGVEAARGMARELGYVDGTGQAQVSKMLDHLREPGSALDALVRGELAGMFDGPTTDPGAFGQRFVHLDLSAVYHTSAVSVVAVVASGALRTLIRAALESRGDTRLLFGVDEGGVLARDPYWGRFRYTDAKFGRGLGQSSWDVYQLPSDVLTAGAEGSTERAMAVNRVREAEIKVCFNLPDSEEGPLRELGFTDTEVARVLAAPPRVAVAKVGTRSFLFSPVITDLEAPMVDTNEGMRGALPAEQEQEVAA